MSTKTAQEVRSEFIGTRPAVSLTESKLHSVCRQTVMALLMSLKDGELNMSVRDFGKK